MQRPTTRKRPWPHAATGVVPLVIALGCSPASGGGPSTAWFEDAPLASDATAVDAGPIDATGAESDGGVDGLGSGEPDADAVADATPAPFVSDPQPAERLWPVPGELLILHVGVDSLLPKMGEATIVVGPTGTITLIDVGNDKHAGQVRALVETLNSSWLTTERGYPARSKRQVEWIVLTHFHADHGGGLEDLLQGDDALALQHGVVHRGWVDVGDGTTAGTWEPLCAALQSKPLDWPLCAPQTLPVCDLGALASHHPATTCGGLLRGRIDDPADDAGMAPTFLDLGGGARLTLLAADGWIGGGSLAAAPAMGYDDTNQENARSVVAWLSFGAFRGHFGGDLTGSGEPTEPDVETRLVAGVADSVWGPRGTDLAVAHHHARKTSNNATLIAALAPSDGRSRNVVGGISKLHVGSPHDDVVARWTAATRLGTGRFWVTHRTFTSAAPADFPALLDADGDVVLRTQQGGDGYWLQAPAQGVTQGFGCVRRVP
ncbi:MAG: MBL fold metallo-hydrolase [Deltaproteobacteria bacterium]|nr:MBL fold metallo-hydrolase [Deltaproteobacteria bacterium]